MTDLPDFIAAHGLTVTSAGKIEPELTTAEYFSVVPVDELEIFLAGWLAASIAAELVAQAEALERWVQYHGLGPHGPCLRCETRTLIAGVLRRRAAALPPAPASSTGHDTTPTQEDSCSTRP